MSRWREKVVSYRMRASKKKKKFCVHTAQHDNIKWDFFTHSTSVFFSSSYQQLMEKGGMTLSKKNILSFSRLLLVSSPSHRVRISRSHRKKAHDDIHLFSLKLHNQTSSSSSYKREYFVFFPYIESSMGRVEI